MGKKVLVVVDMQNDFIDGSLGTKEALEIVEPVVKVIEEFDGEILFTRDTHASNYRRTLEGKNLPVSHCIEGTIGWELRPEIAALKTPDKMIFNKPTFGSIELCQYLASVKNLERVTLVGLCTDICVISNAIMMKAYIPEVEIQVLKDCCAGVTPQSHQLALEAMKMCQITVV